MGMLGLHHGSQDEAVKPMCGLGEACHRSRTSSLAFRKIRLAVAAIDGGAKVMGISSREMHDRLKRQGLIHDRLLAGYAALHTQGEKWVIQDTVETLKNWEAER